MRDKLEYLLKY
jgi:hypothetical protein